MKKVMKILCITGALLILIVVLRLGISYVANDKETIYDTSVSTDIDTEDDSVAEGDSVTEDELQEDSLSSEAEDVRNEEAENEQAMLYSAEEYGTVGENRQEFVDEETRDVFYYYQMDVFFFYDTIPNAAFINQTLQHIYDEYEDSYAEAAIVYEDSEESFDTPYAYWKLVSIDYVGEDYISILYNDIDYMGGAHPYSRLDGITIDCKTGEEVSASQFLGRDDEEILTEISAAMGLDSTAAWDDIDFYLTDSTIVFFYRMPGFWDDVVLQRESFI